jgi:short-subunit dehydrogenase
LVPVELLRSATQAFSSRGGGTIVHVASAAAFYSIPYLTGYCVTKDAIVQMLVCIREEIKGRGVCIQALCPGFVKTDIFARAGADVQKLPTWIWISPQQVVRESMRAVELDRAVCIPGLRYRLMLLGLKLVPAKISRRIAGRIFGNFSKYRMTSP